VNRFLIEGMARAGQGEPFVVLKPGEAAQQAARFRRYIDTPVLTDLKVTFPGFDTYEVEPPALPDLFALRPLTLLGKYRGAPQGAIVITGKTAQGDFRREVKVDSAQASPDNAALKFLWARERIHRLSDYQRLSRGKDESGIKEITDLGLKYSLMTAYTSFVAVDKVKRADGTVETVKQPLSLPQGVSDLAVGDRGRLAAGGAAKYQASSRLVETAALPPALPQLREKEEDKASEPRTLGLKIKVVQVQEELEGSVLQQTLEGELPRLEKCFREAREQGRKLPLLQMTLRIDISAGGQVTAAKVIKANKLPAYLTNRLVQALKQIAFPKPAKGKVEVEILLTLTGSPGS